MTSETNRRILIVDDTPAIHADFQKILTVRADEVSALDEMASDLFGAEPNERKPAGSSYEIASAYQGEQAFAMVRDGVARGERFAMAFVDMRMPPGWDGVETIEKIWGVDPEIQIVICTAYSDHAWEDILNKFGTSDRLLMLKKPFDKIEVCQLACALTEKWRLARHAHLKLCQLQGMVDEQTKALITVNEQLTGEIAERIRSEDAVKASEARYALAAAGANDGLWDWDLSLGKVYYSPRWKLMLGYEPSELTEAPEEWLERIHPEDRSRFEADLLAHFEGREEKFCGEYRIRGKNRHHRWMLCRGLAVRDAAGKPLRIAGSQTDMTDRKAAEEQLRHAASHDALTGLANRALLTDRLNACLARRGSAHFAVLFMDLDKFKVINDSLGHVVGDKLLVAAADRLSALVRAPAASAIDSEGESVGVPSARRPMVASTTCLARVGGDEFVLLIDGLRDASDATSVAERIQSAFDSPFHVDGQDVFTRASIGIAPSSIHYEAAEEILRDADTALYQAKSAGGGTSVRFNQGMHDEAMTRWRVENELRQAIERQELFLLFQPVVDLRTGEIIECEALIRWQHPEHGVMPPADFIAIAESSGLIVPLGYWVFRTACHQLNDWESRGELPDSFCLALNVSAKQLSLDQSFVAEIRKILDETGVDPERLRIEITESAMMSGAEALAMLTRIRELGVKFHLDDFGTGYSSLSYLHRMPIDTLKVDQSFVRTMSTDSTSHSIILAIVTLAHALQMSVIAEGVETEEELEALRALNCDAAQGYYLHRPMLAAAAGALLSARRWSLSA